MQNPSFLNPFVEGEATSPIYNTFLPSSSSSSSETALPQNSMQQGQSSNMFDVSPYLGADLILANFVGVEGCLPMNFPFSNAVGRTLKGYTSFY